MHAVLASRPIPPEATAIVLTSPAARMATASFSGTVAFSVKQELPERLTLGQPLVPNNRRSTSTNFRANSRVAAKRQCCKRVVFDGSFSANQHCCGIFNAVRQVLQEFERQGSINDLVVEGQTLWGEQVAGFDAVVLEDNGFAADGSDAENSCLRRVNDRREGVDAKRS